MKKLTSNLQLYVDILAKYTEPKTVSQVMNDNAELLKGKNDKSVRSSLSAKTLEVIISKTHTSENDKMVTAYKLVPDYKNILAKEEK